LEWSPDNLESCLETLPYFSASTAQIPLIIDELLGMATEAMQHMIDEIKQQIAAAEAKAAAEAEK
jgi:hypothetical protein